MIKKVIRIGESNHLICIWGKKLLLCGGNFTQDILKYQEIMRNKYIIQIVLHWNTLNHLYLFLFGTRDILTMNSYQ